MNTLSALLTSLFVASTSYCNTKSTQLAQLILDDSRTTYAHNTHTLKINDEKLIVQDNEPLFKLGEEDKLTIKSYFYLTNDKLDGNFELISNINKIYLSKLDNISGRKDYPITLANKNQAGKDLVNMYIDLLENYNDNPLHILFPDIKNFLQINGTLHTNLSDTIPFAYSYKYDKDKLIVYGKVSGREYLKIKTQEGIFEDQYANGLYERLDEVKLLDTDFPVNKLDGYAISYGQLNLQYYFTQNNNYIDSGLLSHMMESMYMNEINEFVDHVKTEFKEKTTF